MLAIYMATLVAILFHPRKELNIRLEIACIVGILVIFALWANGAGIPRPE